jgi:RimJ/RimL family protein N-acetyltransferase
LECEVSTEYDICIVSSKKDAKQVETFFYSLDSFDDRNFTPGELEHMKTCTYNTLEDKTAIYWYAKNKEGKVIGALGITENAHRTGGYKGDYCVIHRDYRRNGLAHEMHRKMFEYMKLINARYLIIETCDTFYYKAIRSLLGDLGFIQIGHCPDYYFENEGLLWYFKDFTK